MFRVEGRVSSPCARECMSPVTKGTRKYNLPQYVLLGTLLLGPQHFYSILIRAKHGREQFGRVPMVGLELVHARNQCLM